ncbi:MAG: DNA polymerase III subunit delta', partial [Myxococcales bacterium]|nr:DNA polymerase III subunit delta' [Myxococcales bacterium]
MPLRDVEGQYSALEGLKRALSHHRLHHAYLFAGPHGVGKALAGFGLAQALLCDGPRADGDGCGACKGCTRVAERQHPDLHVLERLERADGKGLEAQIKIDQVRQLQKALAYKSFEGGRRVVVIEEAEAMNPSTANALLKTLEEP